MSETPKQQTFITAEAPPPIRRVVPPKYDIVSLSVGHALIVKLDDIEHAESVRTSMRAIAAKLVKEHAESGEAREYVTRVLDKKDKRYPAVGCYRIK